MDNYFEGIDFTKIEIILLIGVILIFLPVIFIPVDDKIPDEQKSIEFEKRIYISFGVALFLLILSVYLSRKGYTSYTPWLEKLANDKLAFDLQLLQHVDDRRLMEFYHSTFKLEDSVKVKNKDVFGWKPIDEDEKWYSVFTEKIDYRFYEIFFSYLEDEWAEANYYEETDDDGEYVAIQREFGREMDLYHNPELVPTHNNKKIKKLLRNNNSALLDTILEKIPIFGNDIGKEKKKKLKKIMIRKIQIDLLYYSVMMNFRRGLVIATERWMKADNLLKKSEKIQVSEETRDLDVGAQDLDETIVKIIDDLERSLGKTTFNNNKIKSRVSKDATPKGVHKIYKGIQDDEAENKTSGIDEEIEKAEAKMKAITTKMSNRNSWNSDDWRAMGSIYYKWKEAGKGGSNENEFDEQGLSNVEKFWNWWNYTRPGKGLKKLMENDPTEEQWKKHRTIRAVNSLSNSFGYKVDKNTGKAVIFFGVVFALIISVALTNSLDIVIETMQLPPGCEDIEYLSQTEPDFHLLGIDCYQSDYDFYKENFKTYLYLMILFFCFFPLGILFYHQGTILLSAKAAEQMTLGSNVLVFVNFLFILLQAIVVYFLASSIGDVNAFLTFLIVLVTIDAFWVTIFTLNDMRDDVRDAPVFIEWIIFDIIIGMFALVFMINYGSVSPIEDGWMANWPIFAMLLIVLSARAVVDYSYGWKNFWSKFADAE